MKSSLRIFFLCHALALVVSLDWSCNPDSECKDIDYGTQFLMDSIVSPFPYEYGDTLFFKEASGQELIFEIRPLLWGKLDYWLDFSQDVEEGDCAGVSKIKSRMEQKLVNFVSQPVLYHMTCNYFVNSKMVDNKPIFFDVISATIAVSQIVPWGISTTHLTNDRGNEVHFMDTTLSYTFAEHKILGTKEFQNVYSNSDPDGSEIYFNHEFGIVAFKERANPLRVLDRIE